MKLRQIRKWAISGLMMIAGAAATHAQDLLARQAPIDDKIRAIDSVALRRQLMLEQSEFPAFDLYPTWDNTRVHNYGDITLPDSFRIDLRGFSMPTTNERITSRFGYRRRFRRQHKGLDVKVYIGDTIYAAFSGKVRVVANQGRRVGYGKYVVIRHDNGLETIYGHLSKQLVEPNQLVKSGEPIGLGGNTGRSTGSHLHFETRLLGQEINPELLFDFPNQDVTADFYTFYAPRVKKRLGNTSASSGNNDNDEVRYYKVRSGDTLSKIAKRQGTTIDRLCKLNGIRRTTTLRIGQLLKC